MIASVFVLSVCLCLTSAQLWNGFDSEVVGKDDLTKLIESTKSCVEETMRLAPSMAKRFTSTQMAAVCNRKQKWQRVLDLMTKGLLQWDSPRLTRKQSSWLEGLRGCSDLNSCLCTGANCQKDSRNKRTGPFARRKRQIQQIKPARRKEYRIYSDEERRRFHSAMNQLKNDQIDGQSKYDILVIYHSPEEAPGAHWGPAFLPWHRELTRQLEVALRQYDQDVSLPYWDSTLDEGLPDPYYSILWTENFFGSGDSFVEDGPFSSWRTVHPVLNEWRIARNLGKSPFGSLYKPEDLDEINKKTKYEQLTSCVDPYFEMIHGTVHLWVGGHMADIPISPNDPTFFLHHCFVDYIWQEWRYSKQTPAQRESDYPPPARSCNEFHYSNSTMLPFRILNIDGISNLYTDEFYMYEPRPTCSRFQPDCGSKYLFCDTVHSRCLSKIKPGGNCTGFEITPICFEGTCQSGVCKLDPTVETRDENTESGSGEVELNWETSTLLPPAPSVLPTKPPVPTFTTTEKSLLESVDNCNCVCPNPVQEGNELKRRPVVASSSETEEAGTFTGEISPNELVDIEEREKIWFSATVLQGSKDGETKNRVEEAHVIVRGIDHSAVLQGEMMEKTQYPSHPGAVLVPMKNPDSNDGHSEATIQVVARNGDSVLPCHAYCYQGDVLGYADCAGIAVLDSNLEKSDPIPYSRFRAQTLYLTWESRRKRHPDYFLFLCEDPNLKETKAVTTEESTVGFNQDGCHFLRFNKYILVGYAEIVADGLNLEQCKALCRDAKLEDPEFICGSVMFWKDDGYCIVNRESRITKPNLFVHREDDNAIYFDYICHLEGLLET